MSVYKPKNSPFFHYDFQLRNHRFHGTTEAKNRKEAEAVEQRMRAEAREEIKKKRAAGSAPMSIDVAADRYWIEIGQHHKRPDQTEWSLAWLVAAIGKDTPLEAIGDDLVARIVAKRRGERIVNRTRDKAARRAAPAGKAKSPLRLVSPARVNRSVTEPLRKLLRRAAIVWKKTVQTIDWKEHLLKEPAERIRVLREGDEEDRAFAYLPVQYHPIIFVKMRVGPRIAELIDLKWTDMDWGARRITIRGKGDTLETVPMPSDVRDVLWGLQGRHDEYVFAHGNGDRMTYSAVDSAWGRAMKKAGITDLRLHDIRHTAATRLLSKSQNIRLAQKMLRHKDIRSTLRYAHALDEDLRDALEAMNSPGKSPEATPNPLIKKA